MWTIFSLVVFQTTPGGPEAVFKHFFLSKLGQDRGLLDFPECPLALKAKTAGNRRNPLEFSLYNPHRSDMKSS